MSKQHEVPSEDSTAEGTERRPKRYIPPLVLAPRQWTTVGTLANLRSQGKGIPFHRFGTKILYDLDDVEAYEEAARVETNR